MRDDHERANLGAANGLFLRYPIPNALIPSDNDPTILTRECQPFRISGVLR